MANRVLAMRLVKETTPGEVPTTPKAYLFKAEGFGVKTTQQTEENVLLGNGRGATEKTYGVDDIAGDTPIIWGADNTLPFLTHGIGAATTTADATADSWTLSTVYVKDALANHSNGTHTLVCYIGGTSGGTEPVITTEVRGDTIVDGGVTWILMPKLYRHNGGRAECLPSALIEVEDSDACTGGTLQYSRYGGLYANTLGFSLTGDTKGIKTTIGWVGINKADSVLDAGFVKLADVAGYSEVVLQDDFFAFDGCTLKLGGVTASKVTEFNISLNNNATMTNAFNEDKLDEVGQFNLTGNIKALFTTALYTDADSHTSQDAELTFYKANGTKLIITLPQYKMDKVDKMYETNKNVALDLPFSGFDTTASKSITYEVVTPLATY